MILTKQKIEEIEERFDQRFTDVDSRDLLENVKHLQAKEQKSRELLSRIYEALYLLNICGELQLQIEEHLK